MAVCLDDVDDPLDSRQVCGQRAAVGAAPGGASLALSQIGRVLAGEARGLDLLGLLQAQDKLILWQALGPATEAVALQFPDDLAQPLVLGALSREHRPKRDGIGGQRFGRVAHKADSIMDGNALPASRMSNP
jgi:hypothetical protein